MKEVNSKIYYSISDVAKMLDISEFSAREEVRAAQLPYIKIGRCKFISFEDIKQYLKAKAEPVK